MVWFLAGGSVISLAVLMVHKSIQAPSIGGVEISQEQQERVAAQQASVREMVNTRLRIEEAILRTDLNPAWVTNPGDLQKTLLSEGARIRTYIFELQNNRRNLKTYREDPTVIRQWARIEALKWCNMSTRGERAVVAYIDPSTGKKVHQELSPPMLQAMCLVRLIAIGYSERDARQEYDLAQIAHDTLADQATHKRSIEFYLNANNFGPVAVRHSNIDLFGRQVIPDTEQMLKVPEPTPEIAPGPRPIPAPTQPQPSVPRQKTPQPPKRPAPSAPSTPPPPPPVPPRL